MADKWRDRGLTNHPGNWVHWLPGGTERVAENRETGEMRKLHVRDGQPFGKAVEKGQFRNKRGDR